MTTSTRLSQFFGTAALLGVLLLAPAHAAPTVAITGADSVVPGGTLQLAVSAAGFSDLYAYQFDITYDPALFKSTGVSEGGFLGSGGTTFFDGGVDDGAGTITFIFGTLIGPGAGVSGAGDLAILTFEAEGDMFSRGSFAVSNFQALDSWLNPIDVVLRDFAVTIPEPSALALALLAIGAAFAGRLQRRGRVAAEGLRGA